MPNKSIESLLKAAEILERGDINVAELINAEKFERAHNAHFKLECDHGYASTQPMPYHSQQRQRRRTRTFKPSIHRFTHNELEKSRRANLRRSLDRLKCLVPLGPNDTQHTTLGLLEKAQDFIKLLEESARSSKSELSSLQRHRDYWRHRLNQLINDTTRYRQRDESSPVSVTDSTSSEHDAVDVIGGFESTSDVSNDSNVDYFTQTSQLRID